MRFIFFLIVFTIAFSTSDKKFVSGYNLVKSFFLPDGPRLTRVRHIDEQSRALGDENVVLDTVGLVEKHGYPAEEHKVTTDDGYNITFFRIPGSPKSVIKKGKPVVFLQHGLFASSDSWVLLGPNRDFALLLADNGYDVWLGNARGNSYGRAHVELSPEDQEFWNFSFHEIAMWDLPKMIDYALEYTDQKTLYYIGHSMGTTAAFILLAQRPEYNNKIHFFIALAPVAIWKRPPNPLVESLTINGVGIKAFFDRHGIYELGPQSLQMGRLGRALCDEKSVTLAACTRLYFLFGGEDPKQLNVSILSHIMSYVPAGISTKTLFHYRQNINSATFRHFDYGYVDNFRLYGKKTPPVYNLGGITAPVALIYGKNDILSREENTLELVRRLKNVAAVEAVPFDAFNHFDFLWAIDAKQLLYDRLMQLLSTHPIYVGPSECTPPVCASWVTLTQGVFESSHSENCWGQRDPVCTRRIKNASNLCLGRLLLIVDFSM